MKIYAISLASILLLFGILAMPVHSVTYPYCSAACQYTANIPNFVNSNAYANGGSPTGYYCYASTSGGQGQPCVYPMTSPNFTTANNLIDSGQIQMFNFSFYGGKAPFYLNFYNVTSNKVMPSCSSNLPPSSFPSGCYKELVYGGETVPAGGIFSVEILVSTSTKAAFSYNVVVSDSSNTSVTRNSVPNTIIVYPPLSVTVASSSYSVTKGQPVTLTATPSGGVSPYSYIWHVGSSSTGGCQNIAALLVPNTSTYTFYPTSSGYYCASIRDNVSPSARYEGTRNSTVIYVPINNNIPPVSVSLAPQGQINLQLGQSQVLSAVATGGVPPYTYNFIIYNANTGAIVESQLSSSNTFTFNGNANVVGADYYANVVVADSESPSALGTSTPYATAIQVYPPLSVTVSPSTTQTVNAGQSVTFVSNVIGSGLPNNPPAYFWLGGPSSNCNSDSYTGATTANYVATPNVTTYYCVVVTSYVFSPSQRVNSTPVKVIVGSGSTTSTKPSTSVSTTKPTSTVSGTTVVTTSTAPTTTIIPSLNAVISPSSTQTINTGQSISFSASVTGGVTPYTYQWYTGSSNVCTFDSPISGATASNYLANPTTPAYYCFIATDSENPAQQVSSSAVQVLFTVPTLSIAISPSSTQKVAFGQGVSFTSNVNGGTAPYKYQWYNGTSATCTSDTAIAGATTASYIPYPNVSSYYCESVTDSSPTPVTKYSATTYVNVFSSTGWTISNSVVAQGQYETLTANVSGGTLPYTYNFSVYNSMGGRVFYIILTSNAGQSFTFTQPTTGTGVFTANMTVTDSSPVPLTVTNTLHYTVTSTTGTLGVAINPSTTQIIKSGKSVTFTSNVVGGTPPYSYQWYSGTSATCSADPEISGATNTNYKASPKAATYYCLGVSDSSQPVRQAFSSTVEVTIKSKAGTVKANIKPNSVVLRTGKSVTLKSTVSGGTPPYTYSWSEATSPSTTYQPITSCYSATCLIADPAVGTYKIQLVITDSLGNSGTAAPTKIQVLSKTQAAPLGLVNGTGSNGNVTYVSLGNPVQSVTPAQIPNNTTSQTTIVQPVSQPHSIWQEVVSYFQRLFSGI